MTEASFASSLIGVVLDGRYRLDAVLGEGGMGAVFRAQHLAMDRRVAIKLLKPHLTGDDTSLKRFQREARGTFKVESPHAVKVLDYGITQLHDYYIVLEYLDGRTVQRELEVDGAFSPPRVVHVARQALDALAAAHRVGLVHRDLKPDNILLMRSGTDPDYTKVLDFGVAKLMDGAASPALSALRLTTAGMVFGTPEFMSPEQACGLPLDGRSDLYSLAATMFAMLTGRGLFECEKSIEWLTRHATAPPPHLADAVPELERYPELDAMLQRCLSKHREERPPTAEAMSDELAKLERTLDPNRERAKTTPERGKWRAIAAAPSVFVDALPASISGAVFSTTTGTAAALQQGRRRGLWLLAGALIVVAVIAIAIGLAVTRSPRGSASASITGDTGPRRIAARSDATPAALDAGIAMIASAPVDAAAPADAATVVRPHVITPPPVRNDAAAEHVRLAEDARRTGNQLREQAEADLALRADPTNSRARFLMGDALILGGDLDHGCKYLRQLGKTQIALDREQAAGCP